MNRAYVLLVVGVSLMVLGLSTFMAEGAEISLTEAKHVEGYISTPDRIAVAYTDGSQALFERSKIGDRAFNLLYTTLSKRNPPTIINVVERPNMVQGLQVEE